LLRKPRHHLPVFLQLEQYTPIAKRLHTKVTEFVRKHAVRLQNSTQDGRSGRVLYVVYTGAQFYSTRAKWIMRTWGARVPASDIIFVGDTPPTDSDLQALRGATVHTTACHPLDHWQGMCCKWAEAALLAQQLMKSSGTFKWSYLVDDDVYVRSDAMGAYLARQSDASIDGLVFGRFGCGTQKCSGGLCGGGGYAANLAAMNAVVGDSPVTFVKDQMKQCHRCEGWADVAMAMIFRERGLRTENLPGANGWLNSKTCFDQELAHGEPLMYHYITRPGQMKFLNALFTTGGTSAPVAHDKQMFCAAFNGTMHCARRSSQLPWNLETSDPNKCNLE